MQFDALHAQYSGLKVSSYFCAADLGKEGSGNYEMPFCLSDFAPRQKRSEGWFQFAIIWSFIDEKSRVAGKHHRHSIKLHSECVFFCIFLNCVMHFCCSCWNWTRVHMVVLSCWLSHPFVVLSVQMNVWQERTRVSWSLLPHDTGDQRGFVPKQPILNKSSSQLLPPSVQRVHWRTRVEDNV